MPVATYVSTVLDLRRSARSERHAWVLREFDGLPPGRRLLVVSGEEETALLGRLQEERKGLFEWSPLEAGPAGCRIEIARRDASLGSLRGLSEALAWDHARLEALLEEVFSCVEAGDLAAATETWGAFRMGLHRHIRFEEHIVFPAVEARLGTPAWRGATGVMRYEHVEIEGILEAVDRALHAGTRPIALHAELRDLLRGHNRKEERVLFPAAEGAFDPAAHDALVRRIQAMPA